MLAALSDYRHLFLNGVPMMDVRAPVEFAQGAFPGVVNRPLMDDGERQQVGTCYKHKGQDAAIALGHQLVSGATKQARIAAWAQFAQDHPGGVLYCFRGGLRSQIVQQWLHAELEKPLDPAEVAARFTLDSLPGKQMSIDADLNMGIIDDKEASKRRSKVEKEASFYGAMDGATKFVKGDAIAGIIIILINIFNINHRC